MAVPTASVRLRNGRDAFTRSGPRRIVASGRPVDRPVASAPAIPRKMMSKAGLKVSERGRCRRPGIHVKVGKPDPLRRGHRDACLFNWCRRLAAAPASIRKTVPDDVPGISHHSPDAGKFLVIPELPVRTIVRASTLDHRHAGSAPTASPMMSDMAIVNHTTWLSKLTSRSPCVSLVPSVRAIHTTIPPAIPAPVASSRCSTSNWRSKRTRPAPERLESPVLAAGHEPVREGPIR